MKLKAVVSIRLKNELIKLLNTRVNFVFKLLLFFILITVLKIQSQTNSILQNNISEINTLLKKCEILNDTASIKAEQSAIRALALSGKLNNKIYYYKSMLALAKALWAMGKQNKAAIYIDSLVNFSSAISDNIILSDIRFVEGRYQHYRGNYDKALKNYLASLSYSERANDTTRIGEVSNTIGGIYYNQINSKAAYQWYRKSLAIQLHQKNSFRIGRGYLNAGSALILENKLIQAKILLDSSLFYYSSIQSKEGKSYVYGTLPLIFSKQNKIDSSLKYLKLARAVTLEINKLYSLPEIDLQIAEIYLNQNDYKNSLKYADEGLNYCKQTLHNFAQLSLFQVKAKVYEKLENYKLALQNHKLYKIYSDSVLNNESSRKQTEAALQYEFNKKEYEAKVTANKIELQRKQEQTNKNLIFYSLIVFITLLLIIIYWRYQIKNKTSNLLEANNKKLKEKNLIIEEKSNQLEESLAERELLLKEIHHRVKNNLQIISGLLELQKEELKEEGSKAAFDEGQSRVKSISLIHQNLYQNDNLGSIEFKTFVNDLCNQVKSVFEDLDKQMEVQIDMPNKVFDIDTAVPLGLIINELLTNSYKYATFKGKTGQIKITITDELFGNYKLQYYDSGTGIKNEINFDNATSMGLRLIKGLANQLSGMASYNYANGSYFTISFKDAEARRVE